MPDQKNQNNTGSVKAPWRVFAGFDDLRSRLRASEVCDLITRQFWPEIEFELQLCDFHDLHQSEHFERAVSDAATAKILIISTSARANAAKRLGRWMNALREQRHGREGVLVSLVDSTAPAELLDSMQLSLRQFAHQAGLDFLTHAPDCHAMLVEEKEGDIEARSEDVGPVLECILTKVQMPSAGIVGGP